MKVYLVGGAVRDKLLGYPSKENDWVVVGSTPDELLGKGYRQVGKDFPVFLHPKTGEEYALARTERKRGRGYYGFDCSFNPDVTLEEDLARRDLTINAMAMDKNGALFDPYHGLRDLNERRLRHISPAFKEDPVRVLRTARFAARYHHLGFKVEDDTRAFMYAMVRSGELDYLVAERVWQELERSLNEKNPDVFIMTLRACGALSIILPELDALFGIPNPPQEYSKIDSGIYASEVLKAACKLTSDPVIRWASLIHDVGKANTPIEKWPDHLKHEDEGALIIDSLSQRLRIPTEYRKLSLMVCRYHAIISNIETLNAQTMVSTLEKTDAFRRPHLLSMLLDVCESIVLAKKSPLTPGTITTTWQQALAVCCKITAKTLVAEGYKGEAIKTQLHQRRVNKLQSIAFH